MISPSEEDLVEGEARAILEVHSSLLRRRQLRFLSGGSLPPELSQPAPGGLAQGAEGGGKEE